MPRVKSISIITISTKSHILTITVDGDITPWVTTSTSLINVITNFHPRITNIGISLDMPRPTSISITSVITNSHKIAITGDGNRTNPLIIWIFSINIITNLYRIITNTGINLENTEVNSISIIFHNHQHP